MDVILRCDARHAGLEAACAAAGLKVYRPQRRGGAHADVTYVVLHENGAREPFADAVAGRRPRSRRFVRRSALWRRPRVV